MHSLMSPEIAYQYNNPYLYILCIFTTYVIYLHHPKALSLDPSIGGQ